MKYLILGIIFTFVGIYIIITLDYWKIDRVMGEKEDNDWLSQDINVKKIGTGIISLMVGISLIVKYFS